MARPIAWPVAAMTLLVLGAVGCRGAEEKSAKTPEPESSEAKVIAPGSPTIGEARKPGQPPEQGRVAPTMPRTERTDFYLTSPTISHHGAIPARHTCDAEGLSPALAWANPPEHVKSYTIIVDDRDARGKAYIHWMMVNVPADTLALPEGIPPDPVLKSVGGAKQGKNSADTLGWTPLCAEKGPPHRVVFRIYALDAMLDVPPGASRHEIEEAYKGHFLGQAAIVASYARK